MDWNELTAKVDHKTKPRKWKKYVYIIILAVVVILPLWGIISFARYRLRLRTQLIQLREEIRARGEPIFFDELDAWYKWPPEGEPNAADVYLAADEAVDWPDEEWDDLPIIGQVSMPELGEPLPDDMLEISRRFLGQNQKTIELIREAIEIEHCRYPVNLAGSFFPTSLHYSRARFLSRVLSLYGLVAAVEDRPGDAAWSILATLKVADSLKDVPQAVSQLVRIAIINVAYRSLERILSHTEFEIDDIDALVTQLDGMDNSIYLRNGMIGERCFYSEYVRMPQDIDGSFLPVGLYNLMDKRISTIYQFVGWRDADDFAMLRLFTNALEIIDTPVADAESVKDKLMSEFYANATSPFMKDFGDFYSPAIISSHIGANSRFIVYVNIMQTALAVEKYRLANGDLPDSLVDLFPEFMDAIPIDPFDPQREPLRYIRRDEGGYIIYSVWENETDGGGRRVDDEGSLDDFLFTVTR